MTALGEKIKDDAEIQAILHDASIGHRSAARIINEKRGEGFTSEKSVRRYRKNRAAGNPPTPTKAPGKASNGWTPRIEIDPAVGGEFYSIPHEAGDGPGPEEAELLAEFDLDPEQWKIEWARKSKWQTPDGKWLEAQRVSFRRRGHGTATTVHDVDAIMSQYVQPRVRERQAPSGQIVMVASGDLQLGKQEGGGTAGIIDRFCRITEDIAEQLEYDLMPGSTLILPWLGDCIEGIVSQNSRMLTLLDTPITGQVRAYRRLMMHQIAKLAGLADQVIIPVLPGNHDETTRVQMMPVTDSWAIEGAMAVADWMEGRPEYEHVKFLFPEEDELAITVRVGGYAIAFTHGHVVSRPAGMIDWWKSMSHGRQPVGEADMLVTAHFHHLRVEHTGGNRTWLQIPALDGGSSWYRRTKGEDTPPGIVSVEITPGQGQGWKGLTVHS